jgi:hypothetical protein
LGTDNWWRQEKLRQFDDVRGIDEVIAVDVGPGARRRCKGWVVEDEANQGVEVGAVNHAIAVDVSGNGGVG